MRVFQYVTFVLLLLTPITSWILHHGVHFPPVQRTLSPSDFFPSGPSLGKRLAALPAWTSRVLLRDPFMWTLFSLVLVALVTVLLSMLLALFTLRSFETSWSSSSVPSAVRYARRARAVGSGVVTYVLLSSALLVLGVALFPLRVTLWSFSSVAGVVSAVSALTSHEALLLLLPAHSLRLTFSFLTSSSSPSWLFSTLPVPLVFVSVGVLSGTVLGFYPLALDWDTKWQIFPLPVLAAAYAGHVVGLLLYAGYVGVAMWGRKGGSWVERCAKMVSKDCHKINGLFETDNDQQAPQKHQ